jgi:hypothetical protein
MKGRKFLGMKAEEEEAQEKKRRGKDRRRRAEASREEVGEIRSDKDQTQMTKEEGRT